MEQNHVRADICRVLASLISKPDEELIEVLNSGAAYRALIAGLHDPEIDTEFLRDADYTLESLTELYNASMTPAGRTVLLPVESVFKPWTNDDDSHPAMRGRKGLLMGDPALHMLELYRRSGYEIPDEFNGQPDHLALLLEFLSVLYESYSDTMVCQFMQDHLDWMPDLITRCRELEIAPFYHSVFRLVDAFINKERSLFERCYEVKV